MKNITTMAERRRPRGFGNSLLCGVILSTAVFFVSESRGAEPPPVRATPVTIRSGDRPMEMPAVRDLLNDNADRLDGKGGWRPPKGLDPAGISKADYLEALRPHLAICERDYGKDPATPKQYAYEGIPTFVAFYLGTKDARYAELALRAYREYCAYVEEELKSTAGEIAKDPAAWQKDWKNSARYWVYQYVNLFVPMLALEGAPQFQEIADTLGDALARRANAWPIYWERGASQRPIDVAYWYEFALKYGKPGPRAAELRAYADMIWNDWWPHRDVDEDCSGYTSADLAILPVWARLRGVDLRGDAGGLNPWTRVLRLWNRMRGAKGGDSAETLNLWSHYAEQMGNDGTWTWYGDGGAPGGYILGLCNAELAATLTREGRYKWLAHRAFWNGRDRIPDLCAGIGYKPYTDLAMAYLYADDTIREVPPRAGLTITRRRFRERTDWRDRGPDSLLFNLHERWAPSKVIFRSGGAETDPYMVLQAASQGGHGHPDSGSVILYGGDLGYYLFNGVTRLDHDQEHHNLLVLRDPERSEPWRAHAFACEGHEVPFSGETSEASYARLRIEEFPGNTPDEQAWQSVRAWKSGGYPPPKAIGYKNWPVRLDRATLFINNRFAVVRDVIHPILPFRAEVGANWRFTKMGPVAGENWVNVWTPELYGYYHSLPPKQPVKVARRDLLIWFVTHPEGVMQIEAGPETSQAYGNYFIQQPRRVWYPRTGDWRPGDPQAFTTVLLPHAPVADPERLAAGIERVTDEPGLTVISVKDAAFDRDATADQTPPVDRIVLFNSSGGEATYGALVTDAEAALLTMENGRTVRISAWGAKVLRLEGKIRHESDAPQSVELAIE